MHSYVCGRDEQILEQTIEQTFSQTVHRYPDREALVSCHQNVRYTWAQLEPEIEKTARGLAGLGLAKGSRIGIWSPNYVEWLFLLLASARAGVVLVNINPAYRAHELRYVLKKSKIEAIFLPESDERADYGDILAHAIDGQDLPLQHTVYIGGGSWTRFIEDGRPVPSFEASPEDVANIQYTSGTTGSPKGVLLTHRNLVNNGRVMASFQRNTEQDRICVPVPLYHCFGCVIGAMIWINTGAAIVLPGARFHALPTMQALDHERCTRVYGVPTMFIAQLNHPDFARYNFSSLRGGVMAGAPCPVEIMKRVMVEMHCTQLTTVYGQTESSPGITGTTFDDTLEHRAHTVGRAYPNTEVKLVDRENGATVEIGEIGEICTRGYLVMKGYDADPEATREVIDADGWLHTGDLAVMHDDGYLHLTGRAKDMIIRGGENVYPKEVEDFLHEHPKVANVEVVGVPDSKLGEAVATWIIARPGVELTEQEIREFCEGNIAHYKIPQYIRFVDSFPTTVTGKTQKYVIREREIELRGLREAAQTVTA